MGASGGDAGFFYVRRFISTLGGPDQYVAVTCRMGAGGARTPFSLIDVSYVSLTDEPIVFLKRGERLPIVGVDIRSFPAADGKVSLGAEEYGEPSLDRGWAVSTAAADRSGG